MLVDNSETLTHGDTTMQRLKDHFLAARSKLSSDGPGFSAVTVENGEISFELHHGMASVELQVPLGGTSAYYLASESKQFTAACVMKAVRDGLVTLDSDVVTYLPELSGFKQAFPLKSLLNHTSGIPDYLPLIGLQLYRHESDYFGNEQILGLISRLDSVEFETSSEYRYSNSNYILLAKLVERLAGMPLADYAKRNLFQPLGIERLTFDSDRFSVLRNRVTSYEADATRPQSLKQSLANANTVGDGGMYGSTDELVLWEKNWHSEWADQDSLLWSMLQPSPLTNGTALPYRFGLELSAYSGEPYVFHGGGMWGFRTMILRIPARQLSIIHLANHQDAGVGEEELLRLILD